MSISPEQLKEEKKHLKSTQEIIQQLIDECGEDITENITTVNAMKRYIWENNGSLDDAEISSGMYDVNRNVDRTNEQIKNLQKLKRALISPYFGRVDFDTDGTVKPVYIGTSSIMKKFKFYVYDWRTPIASLFYNYGLGEASYTAPIGKITGTIRLKRQFKINGNNIEKCFDSDINIDDDYLQEILSTSSSDKMTSIVNTIQREQNEIIRNVDDQYLIVQGIAGSGKTSVALHRIAYLMYSEKDLTSNNVLIFSPNKVFSEYISDVLPELGEDNVLQTTFSDFASAYFSNYKTIESFTSFVERYYSNSKLTEEEYKTIRYKVSDRFKELLDTKIDVLIEQTNFYKSLVVGKRTITIDELNEMLHNRYRKTPLFQRLDEIAEHICDLTNISQNKYARIVKSQLIERLNLELDIKKIYADIIESDEFKKEAGLKENSKYTGTRTLKYEDLLPLMYLKFELNGYPLGNSIRHIIIDEAQDYTILQLDMLKKIFRNASFTILGDVNQTINPYYMYGSLEHINTIFNGSARYIELLKTYRSSQEIIEYTNRVLGLNNVCAVRRNNSIPVQLKDASNDELLGSLLTSIKDMQKQGMRRLAIITRNNSEAKSIYEGLKDKIDNLSIASEVDFKNISDIVVVPSYIAKGLEFDGVIVCTKKENAYTEREKYLYYVVCTRAQHSLTIYNQKTLTLGK